MNMIPDLRRKKRDTESVHKQSKTLDFVELLKLAPGLFFVDR